MDHAADAFRTDLMTITPYLLNEQSRHPESRDDFTILLSHIVLGCKFVATQQGRRSQAHRPLSSEQRAERSWTCSALPTRCWSMPLSPVAAPVFLCPRRLHTWTESSVGTVVRVALHFPSGTVSALIPWMAPPTSTAACPSEWYAHK
ncbi:hypothetical protein VPH35_100787 [Triticum aestivum]